MKRTISCLAYWSPSVFGHVKHTETLTKMIFPFVILFNAHTCETFEMLATILVNWTQGFWDGNEPPQLPLTLADNILQIQDPALYDHFLRNKLTPKAYIWAMVETLFSETFSSARWARIWDHLVTQEPGYLYTLINAVLVSQREVLMDLNGTELLVSVHDILSACQNSSELTLE
ncbi:hypothetical protein K493DRAFT_26435 [Basidiobolus meristosporus CBS 931.73]|uniref:Rab-GAP TBC domain-containing protein n=1 Tax=Basidiobolus meristosporus CBS 931.73 TaxID=1314790 RepID=A0A1Y1YB11_9FUNG|nr:hypothetical protein K493DRAFT_26435 [Basidiobolus meristosporus CBS 931.73]|eukprot:ORX95167.1 hypothetical protein K493DRAFT_26435 [Basidiobolus meristosporus CBS 931.73]